MASRGDLFGLKNALIEKLMGEIFVGICGHFAVRRQESGLCAKHYFVPGVSFRRKFTQCRADRALAALETVVDGGIDHVNAAFHCCHDGLRVTIVCFGVRLAEISSDTDGRKYAAAWDLAKMPSRRSPLEPCGVAKRSLRAGRTGDSPVVCCRRRHSFPCAAVNLQYSKIQCARLLPALVHHRPCPAR